MQGRQIRTFLLSPQVGLPDDDLLVFHLRVEAGVVDGRPCIQMDLTFCSPTVTLKAISQLQAKQIKNCLGGFLYVLIAVAATIGTATITVAV